MHEALTLLGDLTDADRDWILDNGEERQVIAETRILEEGATPDALWFVLEGLVGVYLSDLGDEQLYVHGPGELLGEMSFLEQSPATATVRAVENTLLLALSRRKLEGKLEQDAAFAARLYRSLARIVSQRLRRSVGVLGGRLFEGERHVEATSDTWRRLAGPIDQFKSLMHKADREGGDNGDTVSEPLREQIRAGLYAFIALLNEELGDESPLAPHIKERLGSDVQRELLPYVLLTRILERTYTKPRGYAGDFQTIEWLYQAEPGGKGRLGPLIDGLLLLLPCVQAVQNRRGLLAEEIRKTIETRAGDVTRVVSLACGPARELFDVYAELTDPAALRSILIDIDAEAVAMVEQMRDQQGLQNSMDLVQGNLVYLATGRQQLEVEDQDLVYSIGLIDYFNDKFVVALLNFAFGILRPGGRVILGNFHLRNPDKAFMDHVLDWKLIHRDEGAMDRLFEASAFARPCTNIRFEGQGVNLFAECVRE